MLVAFTRPRTFRLTIYQKLYAKAGYAHAEDLEGQTPLFGRFDAESVRLLLDAGADIEHRASDGTNALFSQGNAETTVALIAAGADVIARSRSGRSALESARSHESALVILRAGATLPTDPAALKEFEAWAARSAELTQLLHELRQQSADK